MIGDVTVTITYMDGQEDIIDGYQARAIDGILHVTQRMHSGKPDRHIPLANVREYTTTREH